MKRYIIAILFLAFSHLQAASVLWAISLHHSVGEGFHTAPTYAENSLAEVLVTSMDFTSSVPYTSGRVGGSGDIRLLLSGNKLEIFYDLTHTISAGGFADVWNEVRTTVRVTPYVPLGDEIRITVANTLTTVGFHATRGDPARSPISDVDITGGVGPTHFFGTIDFEGTEYGQHFENWNNGFTIFHVGHLWNFFGETPHQEAAAFYVITVTAENISVPEPSGLALAALGSLLLALRRRRKVTDF